MRYSLHIAIICFIIAMIALSQMSCVQADVPLGDHKVYVTLQVTDEWCMIEGKRANGFTRYSKIIRSAYDVCVSTKSDDIRRTMNHEFEHVWLNATGNDPQLFNP